MLFKGVGREEGGVGEVEVLGAAQLGAGFAEPAAVLVDARVYAHEVDARQGHGVAVGVHGPVYLEAVELGVLVGMVVDVAVGVGVQHALGASSVPVNVSSGASVHSG